MAVNPLQAGEIVAVLDLFQFHEVEARQRAFQILKEMDGAFLTWHTERNGHKD